MEEEKQTELSEPFESVQESSTLGSIRINNDVVAAIVSMAAKEVPGVVGLASGGLKDDIAGLFGGKRDTGSAISISETPEGAYHIGIKLILSFGVQLAKVAEEVQMAVREQVENMTNKDVVRVDIVVDGVRQMENAEPKNGDQE